MDNSSHTEELIERYILGEMSGEELRSFELKMDGDSELREEISLQKDIVSALQIERRTALKARMDNVKIPSPYASYYTAGIASLAIIGGIALITTLWPNGLNQDVDQPVQKTEIIQNEIVSEKTSELEVITEETQKEETIEEALPENTQIVSKSDDAISKDEELNISDITEKSVETTQVKIITPKAPDPSSNNDITASNLEGGSDDILNNEQRESSKVEVEIKASKSYDFHYQHFNNKLFLYGDFSKSPYELIELNTKQSKNLYMYFSGKYYTLNSNQMEVTKLNVLRDKIIIKGLDNLRLK